MAEFVAIPDPLTSQLGLYSLTGQVTGWISPVAPSGGGGTTIVNQIVQSTTFFLRGFYPTSGQYEFWSGPSRNTPNPSGHSLTNITVVAELVGTGNY
jgi:hypothetical protein